MANRPIPRVLWVGLIALGLMVAGQILASLRLGPAMLLSAVLSALLLWGLYRGHRWAYVFTVVIVPLKLILAIGTGRAAFGLGVAALDCLVLLPVLASARYFWGRVCPDQNCGHRNPSNALYCAHCGQDL